MEWTANQTQEDMRVKYEKTSNRNIRTKKFDR